MTKNEEAPKDVLIREFLKNFPNFGPMVKSYYTAGENKLKIYTKQGKKFFFVLKDDGFELTS